MKCSDYNYNYDYNCNSNFRSSDNKKLDEQTLDDVIVVTITLGPTTVATVATLP